MDRGRKPQCPKPARYLSSCFDTIPACDRRTHDDSIHCASMQRRAVKIISAGVISLQLNHGRFEEDERRIGLMGERDMKIGTGRRRGLINEVKRESSRTFRTLKHCTLLSTFLFTARCIRGTSHGPVSVCVSQVGVLLKWLDGSSWFLAWRLRPVLHSVLRKFRYLQK